MSQAQPTTGSATQPAAVTATTQAPQPSVAAPAQQPAANIQAVKSVKTQKNYSPQKAIADSTQSAAGLSQLLDAVSDKSFQYDRGLRTPNFVVPCLIMYYQIIGLMDTQMAHTKRYTDANPDWHPHVSQLYFAILAFYQILTLQAVGNQISNEQRLFLEFLETQFNVRSAKIPGPMVPFFQSLAACSGPNPAYGNVTFGIPNNLDVRQNQHFLAINRINAHLPSVIFILDQFMRLIQRFTAIAGPVLAAGLDATDSHYMDIYGTAAVAGAANEVCMKTPSARTEINVSLTVMNGFFGSSNLWRNVMPFDPATNQSTYIAGAGAATLSFAQILGFEGFGATAGTNYNWFGEVGRIMQPYSDFFRDSVSLGSINTTGIGAIYIRTRFLNNAANAAALTTAMGVRNVRYRAAAAARYIIPDLQNITTSAQHQEDYLELVTEQLGLLTQMHVTWDVNINAASVFPGPLTGNINIGSVWTRIFEKNTSQMNVGNYIPNLISGYYHTPAAGKFGN
jgi:hypothetical protein